MGNIKHSNAHNTELSSSIETNDGSNLEKNHPQSYDAKNNSEYLSFIPARIMFPILVIGIFTFYATYGYLQEVIIFQNQINPSIPLLSQYFVGLVLSTTISYLISRGSEKKGLFGEKEAW